MISSVAAKLSENNINIESMSSQSKKDYSYSILDTSIEVNDSAVEAIKAVDGIIRVRVIK